MAQWEPEVERARGESARLGVPLDELISPGRVILRMLRKEMTLALVLLMSFMLFSFLGPMYFVDALVEFAGDLSEPVWVGVVLVIFLFVNELVKYV
jgi:hypothetical protein